MLNQLTRFGILVTILFLLPWLTLIIMGGYWFWQQGWLYHGIGILTANVTLVYSLLHCRKRSTKAVMLEPFKIQPNSNWSDKAQQAWLELTLIKARWQTDTNVLTDSAKALKLTNEVLTQVAKHFHSDSKYPILEFPLPYLLKLIVLVCEDLQHDVLDKIPGSHAVRVGDLLRVKHAVDTFNKVQSIMTLGGWIFNWTGAALAKARSLLIKKGLNTVTTEISQRLLSAYVDKLGYYAIQLYSGQLTLDDIVPSEQLSAASKQDIAEINSQNLTEEPFRILVIGQISSGKSSLINALFGEIKSAEGLLPITSELTPYLLERDGIERAIILDSAGYGGMAQKEALDALTNVWAKVDVILIVCHAMQAARQADELQLNAIRSYFQKECVNQTLPIIVAVVTHIDRLRPLQEWHPPYNIQQPNNAKSQNIRAVCETIAHDLNLPLDQIVPVCLAPEKAAYNIDDGLVPLIYENMDAAQRVRYLRCLRQHQAESYWKHWRKQASEVGRLIFKF